ncbi:MaoC family dehydratase N-terminal domain-containing protein [Nocardia vinacea]|uniref:FAS1-like dehydratase domain-containing protein n=1 Tax=Nocardia vinacea TaxID=96468 RepID=UPI0033E735B5
MNTDFRGRVYPVTRAYEVSREKIREFASALGDDNPAYHDVAAARALGHPDLVAPPTFLVTLTLMADDRAMSDPEFGLARARLMHRDLNFTHLRPVHAGDALTLAQTITRIDDLGGHGVFAFRTEIRSTDDELVCVATSSFVQRAEAPVVAEVA